MTNKGGTTMTTNTATDRTTSHYVLIERNGAGTQNWKSTPIYSMQEAMEERDIWMSKSTRLVGERYEVRAILNDGTYIIL